MQKTGTAKYFLHLLLNTNWEKLCFDRSSWISPERNCAWPVLLNISWKKLWLDCSRWISRERNCSWTAPAEKLLKETALSLVLENTYCKTCARNGQVDIAWKKYNILSIVLQNSSWQIVCSRNGVCWWPATCWTKNVRDGPGEHFRKEACWESSCCKRYVRNCLAERSTPDLSCLTPNERSSAGPFSATISLKKYAKNDPAEHIMKEEYQAWSCWTSFGRSMQKMVLLSASWKINARNNPA